MMTRMYLSNNGTQTGINLFLLTHPTCITLERMQIADLRPRLLCCFVSPLLPDCPRAWLAVCRDLSGGEVYRFAIAMALARGCGSPTPPVLLLDDVFDKSDPR